MMSKKVLFFLIGIVMFNIGCGNKKADDPILLDAAKVQDEALKMGIEADSILSVRIANDTSVVNQQKMAILQEELATWRTNLIEVPGIEHDHEGHDHDHDHNHDHGSDVSHLKPEEILAVQKEWKTVVENIYNQVKQ